MKLFKNFLKILTVGSLLIASTAFAGIHTPNCPMGCPELDLGSQEVVFERLYTLAMNPETKQADWVAYEVDVANFGVTTGRQWKNNPLLDPDVVLEPKDYGSVGDQKLDRGHQAPLASFVGSRFWYTLNYLSNITPQASPLNQGPWKNLEQAVRDGVAFRDSLFVITGPVYEHEVTQTLPKADETYVIPSGYFKLIYDKSGQGAAFFMDQASGRREYYCDKQITIAKLSRKLDFNLPSIAMTDTMVNRLGCK